ncbi:MAG: PQQ-binding-like beta-propeller repeat protein [Tannerella sp.]|jgi:outer membrane protein assembly factor BamB|nr:PQQ-binding-like beta-propeller repeat protein [Tannerella sp.]
MKILIKFHTRLFFSGLLLFLILGCNKTSKFSGEEGANWTIFRGDPGLSGYSKVKLPENPQLLWTYKSDSRTSSSPVIYDRTVYWVDKRGQVYGIDTNGERIFTYDFATAVEASPMISDSILYIGRIDGFMSALSLTAKDTVWNFETLGQISATPNIGVFKDNETVIFGSYDNNLYCLDKSTGKLISSFESGYYINGAVALMQNFFVSGGCDAWLKIIDGENSIVSDSLKVDTYIPSSPAIDGNDCYIADHSGNVYALVIEKGKILSSKKMVAATEDNGSFVSVPALSPSTLYILSDDHYLYAIDRQTSETQWKYLQKGISGESSPLVCHDKIISCTRSGVVSLLDARKGELLWEYDTGEQITASPAVVNGKFYILTAKGTLFCFGEK